MKGFDFAVNDAHHFVDFDSFCIVLNDLVH